MNPLVFDQLDATLKTLGPAAALDELCVELRASRDYDPLFYALLAKRRHEMGLNPVPTTPSSDLPKETQATYEAAIREAGREVGRLHLDAGNLQRAWVYYRMIGEPEPVRDAVERHTPGDDEDIQPLIQIAFYDGLHPRKGFDWVLSRYGLCSAITTVSGQLPHADEDKLYFVGALVRALYNELRYRLAAEIENHEGVAPPQSSAAPDTPGTIDALMQGRDWLFAEDAYHIDTSHLSSIVQMSMHLKPGLELELARELCRYGQRLTGRFVGEDTPPFDKGYRDYEVYLAIMAGEDVEGGLAHFRAKLDAADPEEIGTYPAEVLVNLLLKTGRDAEAVDVARKHLARADRQLTCPDLDELCHRFRAYDKLSEVARERGDAVLYLTVRIAAGE